MRAGPCRFLAGRGGEVRAARSFSFVALTLALVLIGLLAPATANAQTDQIPEDDLAWVFPDATRFSPKEGNPPVYRAFAADSTTGIEAHVGFVFLTSDVPPETTGYTAPIRVLVGMDLTGTITGVRVISYRESLRSNRGDFLGRPGIQGQFRGKSIMDEFRVRRDVETVTGATITVIAMAAGIRNAARRVAVAYMTRNRMPAGQAPRMGTITLEELDQFTWPEIAALEMSAEVTVDVGASDLLRVSLAYLRDEAMAEAIIGPTRFPIVAQAARGAPDRHLMFVGLNGPTENDSFLTLGQHSISFVQAGDTVRLERSDFVSTGLTSEGRAGGVFRRTGVLLVPPVLDVRAPFTVLVDLGDGRVGSDEYAAFAPPAPPPTLVAGPTPGTAAGATGGATGGDSLGVTGDAPPAASSASTVDVTAAATEASVAATSSATPPQSVLPDSLPAFDFSEQQLTELLASQETEDASSLSRTISQTSWARVIGLLVLLALVTWAFVSKRTTLRWVALAGTLAFLGFVDRGFLSVSHILAGITSGPAVYVGDLSLLILATFTVVTTVFWGRVFCGFLCPFGALQDLLDRVVPKRFRREFSRPVHERALWAKYGILGIVLTPALVGAPFTLYHYFEPFGTVFFWSPSILLWSIAIGILAASAIIPRFYCRYMCPLGAALAVGSLLSPFRIRRVEQCTVCKVCERACPTGAIEREKIDFKECVRCNACETKLIEKAGVCRHDIEVVRTRLVQIKPAARSGV